MPDEMSLSGMKAALTTHFLNAARAERDEKAQQFVARTIHVAMPEGREVPVLWSGTPEPGMLATMVRIQLDLAEDERFVLRHAPTDATVILTAAIPN
eukprot:SAG31_NODE_25873_length_452_cov_1.070822_2_plen_96_part_01